MVFARLRALAATLCFVAVATTGSRAADAPPLAVVRVSVNPHFISYTAFFYAVEKGYFKNAGIDLQITKYLTSANAQLPMLARGDLDITPVVPGPALFNQYAQGFDAKLIASITEARPGYLDGSVLVVRKDLADKIKKPADLAGKNVDGAFAGSPIALLTQEAIESGGLKLTDVTFSTKESAVTDQLAALTNKAVDVQGTTEPTATAMQQQGVGVKWVSYRDVMPWYQESYWGVSSAFAKAHPDLVVKFLQAYLHGAADVQKAGGKITPEIAGIVSKWTEIPADTIRAMGAIPYYGQAGAINTDSLDRVQKFWIAQGLVKAPVAVANVYDPQFLTAAKK